MSRWLIQYRQRDIIYEPSLMHIIDECSIVIEIMIIYHTTRVSSKKHWYQIFKQPSKLLGH